MMITCRISFIVLLNELSRLDVPVRFSGDLVSAEVQPSSTILRDVPWPVRLDAAGSEHVKHVVAARHEKLGDQSPVAPPPRCLGAHEARVRLGERRGEGIPPLRRLHPSRVAAEGADSDARKALFAGLAASSSAEVDRMPVLDAGGLERAGERVVVELR